MNINRWRYGDTKPVLGLVNPGTEIEIGDLVYQEIDDIRPASAIPNQGSTPANQRYFVCRFLGHASQRHRANHTPADDNDARCNTAGVHEYECAAQAVAYPLGERFGPAADAAGTGLQDQFVVRVGADDLAVGRLARRAAIGATSVLIELISEVMAGGLDAETCVSSSSSGE